MPGSPITPGAEPLETVEVPPVEEEVGELAVPAAEGAEQEEVVPYETLTGKTVKMLRFLNMQFATQKEEALSFNGLVQVRSAFPSPLASGLSCLCRTRHARLWPALSSSCWCSSLSTTSTSSRSVSFTHLPIVPTLSTRFCSPLRSPSPTPT